MSHCDFRRARTAERMPTVLLEFAASKPYAALALSRVGHVDGNEDTNKALERLRSPRS
jgi:hypothetical protein